MKDCPHKHGEYTDTYQRCSDCGREIVLIGDTWWHVEAWVRMSSLFFTDDKETTP